MIADRPAGLEPGLEKRSFAGRRVLVLGLGRFGGGRESARFLLQEGADVLVSDSGARADLQTEAAAVEALGASVVFGPQGPSLLEGRDLVLAGPAIPFDHPLLDAAERLGLAATTETNIVLARCPCPIVGITGTKGKSTTTTLVGAMVQETGRRVFVGGNIGRPLVAEVASLGPRDVVVLELSSFQLWWSRRVERAVDVAVVLNLHTEHVDRHGTFAHYAAAKRALLDRQGAEQFAVLPRGNEALAAAGFHEAGAAQRVWVGAGGDVSLTGSVAHAGRRAADLSGLRLFGRHNLENALFAAAATWALDPAAEAAISRGAARVEALPHRLQPVAEVDGVLYVDDSNSTHPEATLAALRAFERPIVLLAGGKDKGAPREPLLEAIRKRAKGLVGLGTTGPELVAAVGGRLPAAGAATLDAAVQAAAGMAEPGDVVLLSPAFSSLDQFASFAVRGDQFQAAVARLCPPSAKKVC